MANWQYDPTGLTRGDLNGWRRKMFKLCPNPTKGTIVITEDKEGKQVGYKCQTPRGFDTRWARVSRETLDELNVLHEEGIVLPGVVRTVADKQRDYTGAAHVDESGQVYLGDGVYVDADDCWF